MDARRQVLIVGGGFAGLAAARELAGAALDVTVVDQRNYHLFQPLLYQVASGGLSPGDIAEPIRFILARYRNIRVRVARVLGIDPAARQVLISGGTLHFDYLILAPGAVPDYFGHDDWKARAPSLKTVSDALDIRNRILSAFERAEWAEDPQSRARLLRFVVIGGGATGVELAGAIAEIALKTLRREYRNIDPAEAEVFVLEMGNTMLPGYPAALQERARQQLEELGVRVRLGHPVQAVDERGVTVSGECIPAATVVWAAGVRASGLSAALGVELDRKGRIKVLEDLSVPGHPTIFAAGDIVSFPGPDGQPLPGVAPVAIQMGRHAAALILADLQGRPRRPFRYRDRGTMATIGRSRAVAAVGRFEFSGRLAWLTWVFVHLFFLIGLRDRLVVFCQWIWTYFTWQRNSRLIRQDETPAAPAATEPGDSRLGDEV